MQTLLLRDGDALRFGPSQEAGLPELDFQIRPMPQLQQLLRGASLGMAAIAIAGLGLPWTDALLHVVAALVAPISSQSEPRRAGFHASSSSSSSSASKSS